MSDYIKRSDLASDMSDLLISPWALEGGAVSVGIREALHMVQDMANDEVPDNFRLPDYDVVEVVRCKDCGLWDEKEHLCSQWSYEGGLRWCTEPHDYCSYGERKEG